MLSENRIEFTKENIDIYLKDLAKAYRKVVGKDMHAEIILIGGASVLINYGFRDMTTDIDAMIHAASAMKDLLQGFEAAYPGVTRESNVDDIAENLQKKVNRASFLAELRGKMSNQAPEIREPDDELEL